MYVWLSGARNDTEELLLQRLHVDTVPCYHKALKSLLHHVRKNALQIASRIYLADGEWGKKHTPMIFAADIRTDYALCQCHWCVANVEEVLNPDISLYKRWKYDKSINIFFLKDLSQTRSLLRSLSKYMIQSLQPWLIWRRSMSG